MGFRVLLEDTTNRIKGLFSRNGTSTVDPRTPYERAMDKLDELYEGNLEEVWSAKDLNKDENWTAVQSQSRFSVDLAESWNLLHYWYHFRGPVKNVTNNIRMLMGVPFATFEKDGDERDWKDIGEGNGFPARWGDIEKATILLNDYFTTTFEGERIVGDRPVKVAIRNVEPWNIRAIERDKGDPEKVLKYIRNDHGKDLEPENTVWHNLDKIGNPARGIPIWNGCLRELHYAYKLMENVHWVYHIRARLPAVRKIRGGSTKVEAEKTRLQYLPQPGAVPIENFGVEWQFPPIQGPIGAAETWTLYMMAIAANWNLPVFLVTSDFSNHALASTLAADSPTIRMIQYYRDTLTPQFKRVVSSALGRPVDMSFQWPPIIEHDPKKLAERYEIEIRNGLVSKETASKELGHDWDKEGKLIQNEIHQAMSLVNNSGVDANNDKEKEPSHE